MLRIDGLRKRFETVQAIDGVTFDVRPGEVFGFLGANGAGKTTTMRIVLGFLHADEGRVTWKDREAREWPRRTWGYMPEERGLYLRMPVLEQLEFYGSLYGMRRPKARVIARREIVYAQTETMDSKRRAVAWRGGAYSAPVCSSGTRFATTAVCALAAR